MSTASTSACTRALPGNIVVVFGMTVTPTTGWVAGYCQELRRIISHRRPFAHASQDCITACSFLHHMSAPLPVRSYRTYIPSTTSSPHLHRIDNRQEFRDLAPQATFTFLFAPYWYGTVQWHPYHEADDEDCSCIIHVRVCM